jgi:3-oxoacyl-[acyl-carrier protein] reductase
MRLVDKVSIITGAGSGIGHATAVKFAKEGAKVAVCDINEAAARKVARKSTTTAAKRSPFMSTSPTRKASPGWWRA